MSDSPLRYPAFRNLLAGASVNSLGNGIAPVALAFAVLDLGGSATDLGIVVGLYALTDVLVALFGGVLGDRLPRAVVMRTSSLGQGVAQAVAALSLIGGWSSLTLLAVAGVAIGGLGALGNPSSSAITSQTVPAALLRPAITLRRLSQNAGVIVGSGLGGVLVATTGSGWALAVDAFTFVFAAAAWSFVQVTPVDPPSSERGRTGLRAEVVDGFREVMRHTWLWVLLLQAMLYHLFYGGAQGVLGPIVVGDSLGRAAWGAAIAVLMAGFVVGGLLCLRWKPRRPLYVGAWFLALTACFPFAMAFSDSLVVVLLGAFLHGFGLEIFSVGWDLSIQENVAPDKLSRVYSFDMVGSFVARPIGLALTGPVAELVGFQTWLAIVGSVIVVSVAIALLSADVRRLERRPESEVEDQVVVSGS